MNSKAQNMNIAFNDYHVSLPQNKKTHIPQGGPSRFAQLFESEGDLYTNYHTVTSILFSHDEAAQVPYLRTTTVGKHTYYEVVYNAQALRSTYHGTYTKKQYKGILEPWIQVITSIFIERKPDVVFLNGYGLSNWMILEAAYRLSIPVYIQHAGIWKKEIVLSKQSFSPSIQRIFIAMEKETVTKTVGQIFLNEFTKKVFLNIHHIKPVKKILNKMVVIPLPVAEHDTLPFKKTISETISIGMVGRWDAIKNHSALLRLAKYVTKKDIPLRLSCVTQAPQNGVSKFFETYSQLVAIVAPMSPDLLKKFYQKQDVLIVPSRFDVSPTVVLEALTQGVPVIISKNTGWVDVFKQFGLESMIIDPTASGARITEVIHSLQNQYPEFRSRYSKLRTHLLNQHKPRRVFAQYLALFKSHQS